MAKFIMFLKINLLNIPGYDSQITEADAKIFFIKDQIRKINKVCYLNSMYLDQCFSTGVPRHISAVCRELLPSVPPIFPLLLSIINFGTSTEKYRQTCVH